MKTCPRGCVAVLCKQSLDVLCHAALRARATGAFVASCSDTAVTDKLAAEHDGAWVSMAWDGAQVVCKEAKADSGKASGASTASAAQNGSAARSRRGGPV